MGMGSLSGRTHACSLALSLCMTLVLSAKAQELGSLDWFREEWGRAQTWQPPAPVAAEYSVSTYEIYSEQELAALEQRIAGKPDHPDRPKVVAVQQFMQRGGDVLRYRLWYYSEEEWRVSRDDLNTNLGFFDMGRSRSVVWGMSDTELSLLDSEIRAPVGYEYKATGLGLIRLHLALFMSPFSIDAGRGLRPTRTEVNGENWRGWASTPTGDLAVIYDGRLETKSGIIDVTEYRIGRFDASPDAVGSKVVFSEWADVLDGTVRAARLRRHLRADGTVKATYALDDVRPSSQSEVGSVTGIPRRGSNDPVRGTIVAEVVNDFRPAVAATAVYRDGSQVRQSPLPGQRLVPASPSAWRAFGWVVAGAIVVGLIILRVRHARV